MTAAFFCATAARLLIYPVSFVKTIMDSFLEEEMKDERD